MQKFLFSLVIEEENITIEKIKINISKLQDIINDEVRNTFTEDLADED